MEWSNLPPLSGFLAFECSARHLSFTQASKELHLTQGAISKQIKQLEEQLGFKLFHRLTRKLELTQEGKDLYETVHGALGAIAEKIEQIQSSEAHQNLTLSVPASFALKWLIPRLGGFKQYHPDMELFVEAENHQVDLGDKTTDLAIRYGNGNYPDYHVSHMMDDYLVPVCSPSYLSSPLTSISDLKRHTLLHDKKKEKWRLWFDATHEKNFDNGTGASFSRDDLLAEAAIAGQGIAVNLLRFVQDDLESGRLIRLFDHEIPTGKGYFILCLKENAEKPNFKAVMDWLCSIAKE